MTDSTPSFLERQLELARAAYTPRSDLRERVLDKVLDAPAISDDPLASADGAHESSTGWGRRRLFASGPRALAALGLVALGFAAGWQARSARDEPPPLPPTPRLIARNDVAQEPIVLLEAPPPTNRTDGGIKAPPANEVRAQSTPSRRVARAGDHRAARRPRPSMPEPLTPRSPQPTEQLDGSSAREELALLQRAERAVRAGNAALGLALIAELDVGYPRSKLLEERRAVELMAHCRDGATDRHARAERFLLEQSRSIYADRIKDLCGLSGTTSQR